MAEILDKSSIAALLVDETLKILHTTAGVKRIFGDAIDSPEASPGNIDLPDGGIPELTSAVSGIFRSTENSIQKLFEYGEKYYWLTIEKFQDEGERSLAGVQFTDITDHIEAEKKVTILYNIMNESMDGFDIVSEEGKFVYVNDAYLKM